MKKESRIKILLVAIFLAMTFAACSNDSNTSGNHSSGGSSSGSNSTTNPIVFVSEQALGVVYKAFFYSDSTHKMTSAVNNYAEEIESEGTYTGDPSKEGKIVITQLKHIENHQLVDDETPYQLELTISDGKFTAPRGEVYTRQ